MASDKHNTRTNDELLTVKELAAWLKVPEATVYGWNYTRSGPPPITVGRYRRYRRADVERWLATQANR